MSPGEHFRARRDCAIRHDLGAAFGIVVAVALGLVLWVAIAVAVAVSVLH
jgi:hypothetical protein